MTAMSRNPEAIAEAIRKAQRIAVCSHIHFYGLLGIYTFQILGEEVACQSQNILMSYACPQYG